MVEEMETQNESKPDKSLSILQKEKELKARLLALRKSPRNANLQKRPTTTVRVDNFQRPLNSKTLLDWLHSTLELQFNEENFWLNQIKTHCYLDFPSTEEAIRCQKLLDGILFRPNGPESPPTGVPLKATFTEVSVAQAPTSLEASRGPNEWLIPLPSPQLHLQPQQSQFTFPNSPHDLTLSQNSSLTPPSAPPSLSLLSRKQKNSSSIPDLSQTPDKRAKIISPAIEDSSDSPPPAPALSLDSLFRKTRFLPSLYWQPVSLEEVERRKALVAKYTKQEPTKVDTIDSNLVEGEVTETEPSKPLEDEESDGMQPKNEESESNKPTEKESEEM